MTCKPCPFCGHNKHLVMGPSCKEDSPYDPLDNANPYVRCLKCYAEVPGDVWDHSKRSAIAAWNRRIADDPIAELIGALKDIDDNWDGEPEDMQRAREAMSYAIRAGFST